MRITYTRHIWDERRRGYVAEAVATLLVHPSGSYSIEGDPTYVDLDLSVLDLERGRPVTFGEDPEVWARNLWTAYRTPDLTVDVSEGDTDEAELKAAVAAQTLRLS